MTKKDLEYVKIESTGFRDLCNQIKELQEKNKQLILENERLNRMKNGLRINNGKLTAERNKLQDQLIAANYELSQIKKMGMFEFADKYCSDDSLKADGRAFAKALLGGA